MSILLHYNRRAFITLSNQGLHHPLSPQRLHLFPGEAEDPHEDLLRVLAEEGRRRRGVAGGVAELYGEPGLDDLAECRVVDLYEHLPCDGLLADLGLVEVLDGAHGDARLGEGIHNLLGGAAAHPAPDHFLS